MNDKKEATSKDFSNWMKGLKRKAEEEKKVNTVFNPVIAPMGIAKNPGKFTVRDTFWEVILPKLGVEQVENCASFKRNVISCIRGFNRLHFALGKQVDVDMRDEGGSVIVAEAKIGALVIDEHQGNSIYPSVYLPISLDINRDSSFYQYYTVSPPASANVRGSFLKSKTTGLMTGLKITGLSFGLPSTYVGDPFTGQRTITSYRSIDLI